MIARRNPYIAAKYPRPLVIERTDPKPGDRYFVAGRVVQIPGTKRVEPEPYLQVQRQIPMRQWVGMGLALGALLVWGIVS